MFDQKNAAAFGGQRERERERERERGEQESDSEKKELKIDAVKKMLCVFSLIAQKRSSQ